MTPVFIPMVIPAGGGGEVGPLGALATLGACASLFLFGLGGALVRAVRVHVLKHRLGWSETYFDYVMFGALAWLVAVGAAVTIAFFIALAGLL